MGGHISVGVRRTDGSFRTIGVWTNPLKRFLTDKRFLEGSIEPLDEFFARYLKQDRDDDFGGPQDTVPGEYGFVLVDEIERVVVNWSHYARVSTSRLDEFGIELGRDLASFDFLEDEYALAVREACRPFVTGALVFDRQASAYGEIRATAPLVTDDDLAAFIVSLPFETVEVDGETLIRSVSGVRLKITCPSWQFVELDHHSEADFSIARAHVERCVKLTDAEAAAWDQEFEEMFGAVTE
ncbi:hypothetical protein G6L37_05590 [Agrobacterium rubi]|nr:hypothetical protein [Agrobacterium rubi]NTF24831.1 hypothetical protein [Agrobacterium rubi]